MKSKLQGPKAKVRRSAAEELIVTVTEKPGINFIARCKGKVASCTSGAGHAIKAVVAKVWPRAARSELSAVQIEYTGLKTTWRLTRKGGAR